MSDEYTPPFPGMTKRIAYRQLPMIEEFFRACVFATVAQPGAVEAFQKETGVVVPAPRRGITAMIDEACGFDPMKEILAKFADWVAVTVWGLEGSEGTEPPEVAA